MAKQKIRGGTWLAALGLLTVSAAPAARAEEREPGVLWEHSVAMEMQGFSMPAQTSRFCAPKKGFSEPPGSKKDDHCQVTDVTHIGNRMTWKMVCTGKDAMSGEGEIVQSRASYDGKMTMRSSDGEMRMKMRGKLLGDECDAGELKREVAAIQKQAKDSQDRQEQMTTQACEQSAEEMNAVAFLPPYGFCKDPKHKAQLCGRLSTREGFLAARGKESVRQAGELCGKDVDAILAKLCSGALKDAQAAKPGEEVLGFLGEQCPAETMALGKQECAGRSYTGTNGPDEAYRGFCTRYARQLLGSGRTEPAKADPKIETGKRVLKGLFGR